MPMPHIGNEADIRAMLPLGLTLVIVGVVICAISLLVVIFKYLPEAVREELTTKSKPLTKLKEHVQTI